MKPIITRIIVSLVFENVIIRTVQCLPNFLLFLFQKNMCALPKDINDFYMTTNGISI